MGCGPSKDGEKKDQDKKYDKQGADLPGKQKFIGDVGAVVMHQEERKQPVAVLLAFVPKASLPGFAGLSMVYYVMRTQQIYAFEVSDAELEEMKNAASVSFGWSAIFKSIASDFMKGKAKVNTANDVATVNIEVTSVKDKNSQKMAFKLPLVPTVGAGERFKCLTEPLARVVLRKRQQTDEREREIKYSRMQSMMVVSDANMSKHKAIVDRVMKIIVPLREESARHAKSSAELSAKIASTDRRIRSLQRGKEQNGLDAMYEKGGARPFQHLPFAEEHLPKEVDEETLLGDKSLDYIKDVFPLPADTTVATLTKPPTDSRLVSLYESAPRDVIDGMLQVFTRLDDWDMSVFELEKATNNNALFYVTYAMLYKLDLVNHFKMDDRTLRNFLYALQSGYHPNPYHNASHGADVAQINYYIMTQGGLAEKCKMSKEELLAGVLAGAIHDYDHPGFNNNFHTRTNAYLSTLYNDRSVLENHHCACVYEMLRQPKYNIFKTLTEEQKREVRDTMLEMVLSTDMGNHGRIFQAFRKKLSERPPVEWSAGKEDLRLALSISIKMADISNCGRPSKLYLEWAKNIASEFYVQGDAEAKLCLPISPFMDRSKDKQEFPKGQISFMNFVVIPMFEAISEFLPNMEFCLKHCTENKEYWQALDA
jgi:hypothetical protein